MKPPNQTKSRIILTLLLVIIALYSLPMFLFSLLSYSGLPFFGPPPDPSVKIETIVFFIVGFAFLYFPIRFIFRMKDHPLPKWCEYLVAFVALFPIIATLIFRCLTPILIGR